MSLFVDIKNLLKHRKTMFTTPSHDGTGFVIPDYENFLGRKFLSYDCSEYEGFDNLSSPSGIIKDAQNTCAEILGAENLYFLTNGSTSGIIASMLACLRADDKVLIARNCHKAVYNGLVLTGAKPYWIIPTVDENWGIFGEVSPESVNEALKKYSDIKALIITSPTYNGVSSDIKKIADICKKNGVIFITDEAHGALNQFLSSERISNAITSGADISVQSLHKNCGAPNPCAVLLRRKNSLVSADDIQKSLNIINTTSPSYPLITASDTCIRFLASKKGNQKVRELYSSIKIFKSHLSEIQGLSIFDNSDFSKILIKADNLSGYDLSEILYDDFNIEDELSNEKSVLFLCGTGTSKLKLKKLEKALIKIVRRNERSFKEHSVLTFPVPEARLTPRNAYKMKIKYVEIKKSLGKTCGELISECPPEIPVLFPGEIIKQAHIEYLQFRTDKSLIGIIG